ncbi:plasmid mobilization relaxosome protein MobC [Streptomyces sp. NBC_01205]|uniref:plasmid mobilization relaxosome protein MobC n=1 Tax=Streptomyces sp. NBC_01205 TaxID=2903771 RepID=UPI002E12A4A2|nr:MobC family plasmid mobilization relaxosome protein [Streptomyces sp. NBC_01205]
MADPQAGDNEHRSPVRRRGRETAGPRATRIKVSYNDAELTIVREAADRDNQAVASWVGSAALDVATEKVVPVSADSRDVVAELIQARQQAARIGNNVNQMARTLNAGGTVTDAQLAALSVAAERAIRRLDEATRQVMRERRPRA